MDAAWFDANSAIESERDDEFYSVHDGIFFFPLTFQYFFTFLDFLNIWNGME